MPMTDDDKQRVDRLRAEVTAAEKEAAEAKKAAEAKVAEIKDRGESPFSAKNYPTIDALFQKAEIPTNKAERKKNELINFVNSYMNSDDGPLGPSAHGARPILFSSNEYDRLRQDQGRQGDVFLNALQESSGPGSHFVPEIWWGNFFDRLRPNNAVLRAFEDLAPGNVFRIDQATDTFHLPKLTGASTFAQYAESAAITFSDPTTGETVLRPKKSAGGVVGSNEWFADANPAARTVLETALVRDAGHHLDLQFLAGNGTDPNMRGLRNFTGASTFTPASWTNGGSPTLDHLIDLIGVLEDAGVNTDEGSTVALFMHPRTFRTYLKLKDSQARYQLQPSPTQDAVRRLFNLPVYKSSQISITETVGTSTDTSHIIAADLSQVAIGRRADATIAYDPYGLFANDQTRVRLTSRWDIAPINPLATVVFAGVRP